MPTILIVDDRKSNREIMSELTRELLPDGSSWEVAGEHPFMSIDDYPSWIAENDVAAMLVDQQLHEQQANDSDGAVTYHGHNLVEYLRKRLPDFPIFIITSFAIDDELNNKAPDVEDIINRSDFTQNPHRFVSRIIRAGQRFSDAMQNDLSQLSALSERIAMGKANDSEREKANSIRQKLSLSYPDFSQSLAAELIPKANDLLAEAKKIMDELHGK